MYSVLNTLSEYAYFYISKNIHFKNIYFIHFCCLFLKSSKAFSVSLRNKKPATEVMKTFDNFSLFSGLKINNAKCEKAAIGFKKEVKMALCGMECINLTVDVRNIVGIYFSYSKKSEQEKNFLNQIVKIQNI